MHEALRTQPDMRFLKRDPGTITSISYLTRLLSHFSFRGINHLASSSPNIYGAPELYAVQFEDETNPSDEASRLEP